MVKRSRKIRNSKRSRKYRGGNTEIPVFTPRNLNTYNDGNMVVKQRQPLQPQLSQPQLKPQPQPSQLQPSQPQNMPPLTSNMAVVEHNEPKTYDLCGNKSTIQHIGDSVQKLASHPNVVGVKDAVVGVVSGVLPGAKKAFGLEGGKRKSRRSSRRRKQRGKKTQKRKGVKHTRNKKRKSRK